MVINRLVVLSAASVLIGAGGFAAINEALANQSPLVAQSTQPTGPRDGWKGGPRGGEFAERLGLTDAQQTQLRQIHEASHQQMDTVLTSEQKEQLRQSREQRQRPNLNLSQDQEAKIQAIRQDTKRKMDAVLTPEQRQRLTEQQQQRFQEKRAQLQGILTPEQLAQLDAAVKRGDNPKAAMEGLNLTDAQKQQLRDLRQRDRR